MDDETRTELDGLRRAQKRIDRELDNNLDLHTEVVNTFVAISTRVGQVEEQSIEADITIYAALGLIVGRMELIEKKIAIIADAVSGLENPDR